MQDTVFDNPVVMGDERTACAVVGENFAVHDMLAKREAKRWRELTRGKKHGEGCGPFLLTIPAPIYRAALRTFLSMYQNERKSFMCWLWHRYPDYRCLDAKTCQWCGTVTGPWSKDDRRKAGVGA